MLTAESHAVPLRCLRSHTPPANHRHHHLYLYLYLYLHLHLRYNGLNISYGLLPPELYQTGHFLYHRSQELMDKAWMVHVNFMPGGNSKVQR